MDVLLKFAQKLQGLSVMQCTIIYSLLCVLGIPLIRMSHEKKSHTGKAMIKFCRVCIMWIADTKLVASRYIISNLTPLLFSHIPVWEGFNSCLIIIISLSLKIPPTTSYFLQSITLHHPTSAF